MNLGIVARKDKAMEKGYASYKILKQKLEEKINEDKKMYGENIKVCKTPKEWLDILYGSIEFKDFVKNSFEVKKLYKKISDTRIFISVIFFIVFLIAVFFIGMNQLGGTLIVTSDIALILINILYKTGKTYDEYYNETMSNILLMSIGNYRIDHRNIKPFTENHLRDYVDFVFDEYDTKNRNGIESDESSIDEFKLELIDIEKNKDTSNTQRETVFSGFGIILKNKIQSNILNGSVIKIREDKSLISFLTEDTINSIVQSKRDYSFNSEKLNKDFDCRISHIGLNNNVDDKMFDVTKIITPAFEDRILFLEERYNVFNMNISDNEISFLVNLKKDMYNKFVDGDLLKLSSDYKNKKFDTSIYAGSVYSNDDFSYGNLYPILERLFLYKYLKIVHDYYLDSTIVSDYEYQKINQYENEIKEIMDMKYSEFIKINNEFTKQIQSSENV